MSTDDISALNQIGFASQFVDPDVEHTVRVFHQHCFTCAGSTLEKRISAPFLSTENLLLAETKESRFSHFSDIVFGHSTTTQTTVSRWPSLKKGQPGIVEFEKIALILGQAIGADGEGRRPYPSGGALYSAEAVVVTSDRVEGIPPFSVAHYLPTSNRFELLPAQFDQDRFITIATIEGAAFYVAYFINLKKATFKYRSRGYRLALLEVGSMYQHIAAIAQDNGIASRVLAGFSEYEFTKSCGLDSRLLLPAAIQAFGFPGDESVQ
ncbi:hypothetical protein PDO_4944 [Rhizobium sp. PDO1-076]|uniref:SagB/ThcOx family dehydrogenase n=1 Tax=Rhizobium sp. PDO1-076 TaxID=1125979 RepID=UPI00024E3CA4|nr:SagB/ThcOx family dehydrogenase [Rhizobium sp. PDO1-076]EHS51978.1 hypothetical protein PDO_4944 [Rhizobium sp. PDO1-076]